MLHKSAYFQINVLQITGPTTIVSFSPAASVCSLNWQKAHCIRAFTIYANFELSVTTLHRHWDVFSVF